MYVVSAYKVPTLTSHPNPLCVPEILDSNRDLLAEKMGRLSDFRFPVEAEVPVTV